MKKTLLLSATLAFAFSCNLYADDSENIRIINTDTLEDGTKVITMGYVAQKKIYTIWLDKSFSTLDECLRAKDETDDAYKKNKYRNLTNREGNPLSSSFTNEKDYAQVNCKKEKENEYAFSMKTYYNIEYDDSPILNVLDMEFGKKIENQNIYQNIITKYSGNTSIGYYLNQDKKISRILKFSRFNTIENCNKNFEENSSYIAKNYNLEKMSSKQKLNYELYYNSSLFITNVCVKDFNDEFVSAMIFASSIYDDDAFSFIRAIKNAKVFKYDFPEFMTNDFTNETKQN